MRRQSDTAPLEGIHWIPALNTVSTIEQKIKETRLRGRGSS